MQQQQQPKLVIGRMTPGGTPAALPADHSAIPLVPVPPGIDTSEQMMNLDLTLAGMYGRFRRAVTPLDLPMIRAAWRGRTPTDFGAPGAYIVVSARTDGQPGITLNVFSGPPAAGVV